LVEEEIAVYADVKHPNVTLSARAEIDPTGGSLNALIKESAERLLPLLGEQIQLRSFCASSPFPVVIASTQIDDILERLFIQARGDIQSGGTVLLQATRGRIGTSVVLSVRYAALDWPPNQETLITFHLPAHPVEPAQSAQSAPSHQTWA
jgi:hypothetical protein